MVKVLEFDCVLRDKRRGAELRRAIQNPVISPLSRGGDGATPHFGVINSTFQPRCPHIERAHWVPS